MNPILILYQGEDVLTLGFKPRAIHYDIEKVLEGRYRRHRRQIKTSVLLTEWVQIMVSLEHRLQDRFHSLLHPHAKPVAVHIRKRRKQEILNKN